MENTIDEILDEIYQDKNTLGDLPIDRDLAKQAILALLAQEVNKARIDEWDYIETLRETSDNAMYESMQDRIKDLERLG